MEPMPLDPFDVADPATLGAILARLGVDSERVTEALAIRQGGASGAGAYAAGRLSRAELDALRDRPVARILAVLGVVDRERFAEAHASLRGALTPEEGAVTWLPQPVPSASSVALGPATGPATATGTILSGPAPEVRGGPAGVGASAGTRPVGETASPTGTILAGRAPAGGAPETGTILYGPNPSVAPAPEGPAGALETEIARAGAAGPAPASRLPAPGRIIGRYLLEEQLGAGGMGVVFRAFDRELKREVALKLLLAGEGASEELVQRFQREAQAAAKLSHPNIVRTYDVGVVDGKHYLTMELIRGGSLDGLVKAAGGKLSPREAMRLVVDVAEALAYAHAHGIIHRDLKPENILIEDLNAPGSGPRAIPGALPASGVWTGGLRPKISDFGLARITNMEGEGRLTASGFIMGTPVYMAPEQAEGKLDEVDARSDVYSLGAVLYEMVVGQAPYHGSAPIHVVMQKLAEDPPAPRSVNPALAPDVETILQKAMERDRGKRYAGMREFAEDLRRCLAGEAISARPITRTERVVRWVKRHRSLAAAGALAACALLGLGVALFGPGWIDVETDPPGAEVRLDASRSGATPIAGAWIWPPGEVEVTVTMPGRLPEKRVVSVSAIRTEQVRLMLVRDTGSLSVTVTPETAQIVLEQDGAEVAVLTGSQRKRHLRVGTYLARIRARDHREVRTAFQVFPDRDVALPPVALEHERGRLSVATSTAGASVWIYPLPDCDVADLWVRPLSAHAMPEGEPLLRLPLPLEDCPLDTGRYRLVYRKDGHFTRECRMALRRPGEGMRRNASLSALSLWSRRVGEDVGSSPALADLDGDGVLDVVVGSNDRTVWAFSGVDAVPLWRFETGGAVESSPAVGDLDGDGIPDIAVGSDDRRVYALSGSDGRMLWSRETGGRVRASPALADLDGDRLVDVVVGSWDKQVYALAGRTGEPLWTAATAGGVIGAAALGRLDGDDVPDVAVGSLDGRVHALSGKDGHPLWTTDGEEGVAARPALADVNGDGVPDAVAGTWDACVHAWSGTDGAMLWTYETGAGVNSSAAVAELDGDGVADFVVGADDHALHAISGKSGTPLWSFATGGPLLSSPALHDLDRDGRLDAVVGSEDGWVYAISGADGRPLWSYAVGERVSASPALADLDRDGAIDAVVAAHDGTVRALRAQVGRLLWAHETPRPVTALPAAADLDGDGTTDVVAGSWDGAVRALSGKDGGLLWSARTEDRIQAGATVLPGRNEQPALVLAGSWDGGLRALRGTDGVEVWRREVGGPISSRAAVADLDGDGTLEAVFGCDDRKIYAVALADGAVRWCHETGGVAASSPRVHDLDGDGKLEVVIGSGDDKVYALAGADGTPRWTFATGGPVTAAPVLADLDGDGAADVVIGSSDGSVYALAGRDGTRLWVRPVGAPVWAEAALADLDGDGRSDVAVAARDGSVRALSGKDGAVLWTRHAAGRIEGGPAAADLNGDGVAEVVFGGYDRRVTALDGRDGTLLWSYATEGEISGSPCLAELTGDRVPDVLIGSHDGRLYALDGRPDPRPDDGRATALGPETVAAVARSLRTGALRAARTEGTRRLAAAGPADPFRPPLLRLVALAEFADGRPAEALAALEAWHASRPAGAEAWLLSALVHGRLGRAAESEQALDRALATDPLGTDAAVHALAPLLADADRERLAHAAGGVAERRSARAGANVGDVAVCAVARLMAGDGVGADADATRVLATGEAGPAWHLVRGLARARAGKREEARADLERCFGLPGGIDARARAAARALRGEEARGE